MAASGKKIAVDYDIMYGTSRQEWLRGVGALAMSGPGNGLRVSRGQLMSDTSGIVWNSLSVRPTRFSTDPALLVFCRHLG
jgi:hypothetical protein